jgi:hypothetical protein
MRFKSGIAVAAVALAACSGGEVNAPVASAPLTQADARVIGDEMQSELAGVSAGASTTDFLGCHFGFFPGASRLFHGPLHFGTPPAGCPTLSQDPVVDTDGDGVPDNLTLTFDPATCTFTRPDAAATMELSGALTIIDPVAALKGLRLEFSQLQQKVTLADGSFFLRNVDGPWQLSSDATGFLANDSTTARHESSTRSPSILAKAWHVTFTAEAGSTFSRHDPLPTGDFVVDGKTDRTKDGVSRSFTIETLTALHRDATCTADNKIVSGELHVTTTNTAGTQTVDILFNGCGVDPTITLVT